MNEGLCRFSRAMQKTFAVEEGGTFSFRRCLWLCLPALILGAVLRIALLSAIPEALYGSDSNSYFETASDLYLKGDFDLPAKRRYIYPLLLVAAPLVPFCNSLQNRGRGGSTPPGWRCSWASAGSPGTSCAGPGCGCRW